MWSLHISLLLPLLITIGWMGFLSEAAAGELDLYRAHLQSRSYNEWLIASRKFAVISQNLANTKLGQMQCSYGPCIPRDVSLTPDVLSDLADGKIHLYTQANFNTSDVASVRRAAQELLNDLNTEAARDGGVTTEMSGFKIFADGDEENSWFDLMSDLDRINEVIFSQEIIYPNTKNTITLELDEMKKIADTKILFAYQTSEQKRQNIQKLSLASPRDESALGSSEDTPALSSLLQKSPDLLCLPSDRVAIAPSSQVNTPPVTLSRGIWSASAGGAFGVNINPSSKINSESNPCGPNTLICVKSEAIKYNYPLFAGGKTVSIESIISRHANVGQEYQHADLTPGKPTGQFFESNRSKLNLGANFSLQVVVGELPMPSANMDKRAKKDPKSTQSTPESIKNLYRETVAESFRAYGLTYGAYERTAENTANITDMAFDCDPKNINSACFDRLIQGFVDTTIPSWPTFLPTWVTNQAWNEDIRSLTLFSKSFAQNIELISKEMHTLNNKPRQPQK